MFPRSLSDRVERLIDALIEEGGLDAASLASILLAGRDAVTHGYSLELSRQVWLACDELKSCEPGERPVDAFATVLPTTKTGQRTTPRLP